jgi:hypothetical protein
MSDTGIPVKDSEYVSELSCCPNCGEEWRVEVFEGGTTKVFSNLIGVVLMDRIDHWSCPECHRSWPRGTKVSEL